MFKPSEKSVSCSSEKHQKLLYFVIAHKYDESDLKRILSFENEYVVDKWMNIEQ